MTAQIRSVLKNYFLRGLRPTQSNCSDLIDSFPLISGDTMTGELILSGNPSNVLGAAPKQYVDAAIATTGAPFVDSTAIIKGSGDPTKLLRIEVDGFTAGATRVMTPPNEDFTVVGVNSTQTLTNKKLTDSTCTFCDNGDPTKQLAFECSGITASTTRTVTIPDSNGTMAYVYTPLINSLGSDVNLNNTANYFDGPSVAQGTTGTWFVSGTITVLDPTNQQAIFAKLWDGTTIISTAVVNISPINTANIISLSGFITSPAGNLRISANAPSFTTGKILFNQSGNSKDSTITAIRLF